MPLFTTANAATLGRQGALARWRKPDPPALPPPMPDSGAQEIASQTRSQIAAIDSRLARAASMDAETLDLLSRAKERLWKVLAHAAQIPQPAHRKESRQRRGEAIDLEPVPISVLPAMEPNAITDNEAHRHDLSDWPSLPPITPTEPDEPTKESLSPG